MENEDEKRFGKTKKEREEFQFIEHQLGVIDNKAGNIITIDAVLIIVSTISSIFERYSRLYQNSRNNFYNSNINIVSFFIRTIWTKWATDIPNIEDMIRLRNTKTKFLHYALIVLLGSLAILSLVLGLTIFIHEQINM